MTIEDLGQLSDRDLLVRIWGRVEFMHDTIAAEKEYRDGLAKDIEGRMRSLEQLRWLIIGAVFASGASAFELVRQIIR